MQNYQGYPGHKFKSFKDMNKANEYLWENKTPTTTYVKQQVTRKKSKNYRWSQIGTKSTRHMVKTMTTKNIRTIKGKVLQCKRDTVTRYKDTNVKCMVRTGGIKNVLGVTTEVVTPEVIDLINNPMDQDTEHSVKNNESSIKEVSSVHANEGDYQGLNRDDNLQLRRLV